MVSLPARERGLKPVTIGNGQDSLRSLPARERGLKQLLAHLDIRNECPSLPARERGLKHPQGLTKEVTPLVAPRAGAWIET